MVLTLEFDVQTFLIIHKQFFEAGVDQFSGHVFEWFNQETGDVLDAVALGIDVVTLNIDPVFSGLWSQILSLHAQALYLLVLDALDLFFSKRPLGLSELLNEGVDPSLKEIWTMIAALNDNLSSQNFLLTAESTLYNISELLFVSQLVEAGLVEQNHKDSAHGRSIVRVLAQLEIAQNGRVGVDGVLSARVELRVVKAGVIGNFGHLLTISEVIWLELSVNNRFFSLVADLECFFW